MSRGEERRHLKPPRLWMTEARLSSCQTLEGVAKKAGVTKQLVYTWERGTRTPGVSKILGLAHALHLRPEEVLEKLSSEATLG